MKCSHDNLSAKQFRGRLMVICLDCRVDTAKTSGGVCPLHGAFLLERCPRCPDRIDYLDEMKDALCVFGTSDDEAAARRAIQLFVEWMSVCQEFPTVRWDEPALRKMWHELIEIAEGR